jgi:hypothetical protein
MSGTASGASIGAEMAGKPFRCSFGLHKWVVQHQPESGEALHDCARCGKEKNPGGFIPPASGVGLG